MDIKTWKRERKQLERNNNNSEYKKEWEKEERKSRIPKQVENGFTYIHAYLYERKKI